MQKMGTGYGYQRPSYNFVPLHQHRNWKDEIRPNLQKIAYKDYSNRDLIYILQKLHQNNDCRRKFQSGKEPYSFKMLYEFYSHNLGFIMRSLAIYVLEYKLTETILFMPTFSNGAASYKKSVIFYLTVLMFFGLVPRQPFDKPQNQGQLNCFAHILSLHQFKTKCLVEYLIETIKQNIKQNTPQLCLKIYRNYCTFQILNHITQYQQSPLSAIQIRKDQASIEDFNGHIKIDFANKYIGGGCLRNGCVQEEIMFATRPELYAVTLLCQRMDKCQALAFTGFKRYFNYRGYGDRTSYDGEYHEKNYKLEDNYYEQHIVAIDAVKFEKNDMAQFKKNFIDRQIEKAYAGFSLYNKHNEINSKQKAIITGAWGCGVFNGDFITKIIIQWIAASLAQRKIVICPFGKYQMLKNIGFAQVLSQLSINQLYQLLIQAGKIKVQKSPGKSIWQIISELIR